MLFSSWVCYVEATVSYDHKAIIVDGQRRILISGSIHYPRSTPQVLKLPMWLLSVSFQFLWTSDTWEFFLLVFFRTEFFFFWIYCNRRCGLILFRRPKMEVWMLYKLMSSGMDMSLLLGKYCIWIKYVIAIFLLLLLLILGLITNWSYLYWHSVFSVLLWGQIWSCSVH